LLIAAGVMLPLLKRASDHDSRVVATLTAHLPGRAQPAVSRMPARPPAEGEQYRFHVDMGACIGCKCCVVACNEQNGNPAAINWRRVVELEGGWYPQTHRSYLSMSCNQCLDPTCLLGCPVDAYTKDAATGIVLHSADACIGCQYCTWNCSYGVPQYNPERGVVGKCDMCYNRLELGQAPACVSACPSGAIRVETVRVADWRATAASSPAPGIPSSDHSVSTTRLTLPADPPPDVRPVDVIRLKLSEPHWPLVVMTVLTQLSVGAFASVWVLQMLRASTRLGATALTSLAVGGLALAASTLHLGRPIHAYRALKMWKRSWLSREVLLFTAFSAVATVYAALLWLQIPFSEGVGVLTGVLGLGGVFASARIYRVPSRPSWDTPFTLVQFALTTATLGPLFAAAVGSDASARLAGVAALGGSAQLVVLTLWFFRMIASDSVELQATARLLSSKLSRRVVLRGVLLASGSIVLPLLTERPLGFAAACLVASGAEVLGRYLFFVSAVPRHMTAPYFGSEAA
jgi:Fe-S-cluster-containing dehydrogenase component/DMSO reductase anchor subunit